MPKLHHKYWMCECGHRWYADFSDACPKCRSKHRIRFILDACEGNHRKSEKIGNFDPWKECNIDDLQIPIPPPTKRTRAEKRKRERRLEEIRRGQLIPKRTTWDGCAELLWPWDMAI